MDISVPLTGKAGSTVYLDLVAESNVTAYVQKTDGTYEDVHFHSLYAWNDMNFIKQFMVNGAITKSVLRYCNTESTAQVCNGYLWHTDH